jgi:hypothetical protein
MNDFGFISTLVKVNWNYQRKIFKKKSYETDAQIFKRADEPEGL